MRTRRITATIASCVNTTHIGQMTTFEQQRRKKQTNIDKYSLVLYGHSLERYETPIIF